jgi:hypothetical protein
VISNKSRVDGTISQTTMPASKITIQNLTKISKKIIILTIKRRRIIPTPHKWHKTHLKAALEQWVVRDS